MARPAVLVFRKEMLEALRDRRALIAVLISIGVFPLVMLFMGRFSERIRGELSDMAVPVAGAEHAPALVEWLSQRPSIRIIDAPENPARAVRSRDADVVVVIPEDFAERFAEGRSAEIEVVSDSSRPPAGAKARRIRELLQRYGAEVAAMRLLARGVSPELMRPVDVRVAEVESERRRAAFNALAFIPMFLLMNAFFGGTQISADSIAGERERGSIEALLINALPGRVLVFGKWAAAAVFAAFLSALGIVVIDLVLRFLPGPLRISPSLGDWGLVASLSIPLALLCSALQIAIATYARSYKEAQTYFGYLVFLPMLPFFAVLLGWVESGTWTVFLPILGQHLMILDVLGGEPPPFSDVFLAGMVSLFGAGALLRVASKLFVRESIVFSR